MDGAPWSVQIATLHKTGSLFFQQRLKNLGLGTGLHPYLLALEAGPCHQEALSQRLMVDKANTARALDKLQALGFVKRTPSPEDKRANRVELTPRGSEVLPTIKTALETWETVLREGLSAEESAVVTRVLSRWHERAVTSIERSAGRTSKPEAEEPVPQHSVAG